MKKSIFIIMTLLLTACSESTRSGRMIEWFGDLATAKTERLQIQYDSVRDPQTMILVGESILMFNSRYKYMMTAFDKRTGRYTGDYLRRGNGPGEHIHLWGMGTLGDKFFATDSNKQVELFGSKDMQVDEVKITTNPPVKVPFHICPITQDVYVCSGMIDDDKRYAVFTSQGEVLCTFGDYPDTDDARSLNNQGRAMEYQVLMKYDPRRKELLVWQTVGEYLACYDMTDVKNPKEKFILNGEASIFDTELGPDRPTAIFGKTKYSIGSVALTDKYVVCLFSGEVMQEGRPPARKLLFFSRTGKPVKAMQLPNAYFSMAADEGKAYLLGNDEETGEYIIDTVKL